MRFFEDIVGNEDLRRRVGEAVSAGRFPHAVIIEGQDGIGKNLMARQIAAALLCTGAEAAETLPCGRCAFCRKTAENRMPDVVTVTREEKATIGVDPIRAIRSDMYLSATEAPRKIYIIDSLTASSGYGLLMDRVADKRDEGLDVDELHEWIEANKLKVQAWFFSTDLTFFVKGGRVSKTAGLIGGALKICPLLNIDYKGCLIPREKIRTRKRAIKAALAKMEELADDRLDYSGKVYISQSDCMDDAKELARQVEETFHKLPEPLLINNIGTTIGAHTGPGTVALFFWGDERVD